MQSRFLVMEGVDGSGKTTQAERLCDWMRSLGRSPLHLREPGTTELGEQVRELLLAPHREPWSPSAEALLFFAARRELLLRQIQPALGRGRDVICERFTPSTLAYQGQDPRDQAFILELDRAVVADHQPDGVLILDLPASESYARAQQRARNLGSPMDGMESRGLEYLQRVRQGYLAYATARSDQTCLVDTADLNLDEVQTQVRDWAAPLLGLQAKQ